jgi:phenylacetate-coenzyme A ligase PaaK-like adenylate-forming protein
MISSYSKILFSSSILSYLSPGDRTASLISYFIARSTLSVQRMRQKELKNYQEKRLGEIKKFVSASNTYWRSLLEDDRFILEKSRIRANLKDLRCSSSFYTFITSGSTGEPMKFLVDKGLFAMRAFALSHMLRLLIGKSGPRILRLSFQDLPWCSYQGRYIDPLLVNAVDLIGLLRDYRPEVLYGTVSHVLLFAEFFIKSGVFYQFHVVLTRSESLSGNARSYLESIFKTKVYNIYASREFGPIGFECQQQNGFHINEDRLFLEIVDDRGFNVPDNVVGNILVTSYFNRSLPFVRYRVGDLGRFIKSNCGCGLTSRRIVVDGRSSDFICFQDGHRVPAMDFLRVFLENQIRNDAIRCFQLIQGSYDKLEILLVFRDGVNKRISMADVKMHIPVVFSVFGLPEKFVIRVREVSDIPLTSSGKRKFLVSSLQKDGGLRASC